MGQCFVDFYKCMKTKRIILMQLHEFAQTKTLMRYLHKYIDVKVSRQIDTVK